MQTVNQAEVDTRNERVIEALRLAVILSGRDALTITDPEMLSHANRRTDELSALFRELGGKR